MKSRISLFIALVVSSFSVHASEFLSRPRTADEVKAAGLSTIKKEKISTGWLERTFQISDSKMVKTIYDQIRTYSGPCPCPYNVQKNGNLCGGSSAYSKERGKELLCYPADFKSK